MTLLRSTSWAPWAVRLALASGILLVGLAADIGCSGGSSGSSGTSVSTPSNASSTAGANDPYIGKYIGVIEGDDTGTFTIVVSFDGSGNAGGSGYSGKDHSFPIRTTTPDGTCWQGSCGPHPDGDFPLVGTVDADGNFSALSSTGKRSPTGESGNFAADRGQHSAAAFWTGTIDPVHHSLIGTWSNPGGTTLDADGPNGPLPPMQPYPPTSGNFTASVAALFMGSYSGTVCSILSFDDANTNGTLDEGEKILPCPSGQERGAFALDIDLLGAITGTAVGNALAGSVDADGSCYECPGDVSADITATSETWTGSVGSNSVPDTNNDPLGIIMGVWTDGASSGTFYGTIPRP